MLSELWLYLVTWNVLHSGPPEDLTSLLSQDTKIIPNIYAIGLQEVDRHPVTVLSNLLFVDPWTTALTEYLVARDYVRMERVILRDGLFLFLFVRREDVPYVRNIDTAHTRTRFWGGKGTVTVCFDIYNSNMCFLNSHFQPHVHNVAQRIQDYDGTISEQNFERRPSTANILSHDYLFWMGDLNFRIDGLPNEEVRERIKNKDLESLKQYDQLRSAMDQQLIFRNFHESPITFPPTYNFDVGTDNYDTSLKKRVPSWCDRVLYHIHDNDRDDENDRGSNDLGNNAHGSNILGSNVRSLRSGVVRQISYSSIMSQKESDHKPVVALFTIQTDRRSGIKGEFPVTFNSDMACFQDKDCLITYTISDSYVINNKDWIAIYQSDYRHTKDYVSYVWASTVRQDGEGEGGEGHEGGELTAEEEEGKQEDRRGERGERARKTHKYNVTVESKHFKKFFSFFSSTSKISLSSSSSSSSSSSFSSSSTSSFSSSSSSSCSSSSSSISSSSSSSSSSFSSSSSNAGSSVVYHLLYFSADSGNVMGHTNSLRLLHKSGEIDNKNTDSLSSSTNKEL